MATHSFQGLRGLIAAAVVASAVLAGGGAVARADGPTPTPQPTMTLEEEGAYKAAHDPEPPPPLLSQKDQAWLAKKDQMAKDWLAKKEAMARASENSAARTPPASCADFYGHGVVLINDVTYVIQSYRTTDLTADLSGDGLVRIADVSAAIAQYRTTCSRPGKILGRAYQGQINGYYCGPAAVVEALAIKPGRFGRIDQNAAAWLLNTEEDGTYFWAPSTPVDRRARVPDEYQTSLPDSRCA